jgi:hypothetical protein
MDIRALIRLCLSIAVFFAILSIFAYFEIDWNPKASEPHVHHHAMHKDSPVGDAASLNTLEKAAYFNKPESLYVYESAEVKLVIDSKIRTSAELASIFANLQGDQIYKPVKVGAFLTAKLSAPPDMLEITPVDARMEKVTADGDLDFSWFVKPLQVGQIQVRMDLFSQDTDASGAAVEPVQVMQDDWLVDARGLNKVDYELSRVEPLRAALWTLVSAIGAVGSYFGLQRFFQKEPQKKKEA